MLFKFATPSLDNFKKSNEKPPKIQKKILKNPKNLKIVQNGQNIKKIFNIFEKSL